MHVDPSVAAPQEGSTFLSRRGAVGEWREAFVALYYDFRHGECPYFYIKAGRLTILWRDEARERDHTVQVESWQQVRPVALIANSSQKLRRDLKEAQVDFTLPLDESSAVQDTDQRNAELQRDMTALQKSNPSLTRQYSREFEGPESLIRVEGHTNVGGLYDMLLTMVDRAGILGWVQTLKDAVVPARAGDRSSMTSDDTPQLLARRPFLYSSLQTQSISFAGRVVSTRERRQVVHQQLELSGWMLPCAVKEQCEALALLSAIHEFKSSAEKQLESNEAQKAKSRQSMFRGGFKAELDSVAIAKACDTSKQVKGSVREVVWEADLVQTGAPATLGWGHFRVDSDRS